MGDTFTPELGDRVEAMVPDFYRSERIVRAEIIKVYKNGRLRIEEDDGGRHTVAASNVEIMAKAM